VSDASADPMIGRLLDGRYLVRSRIARGGMGTVYVATDERLERRVAIKIMHGHLADDNAFRNRFVQEARAAARLAHPNVVNVYDQGADGSLAYLVMEYLPGITLRDLLKDYKRLTAAQCYDITEAVLAGLAAAHAAGIIHRDLKPENVMLADDGRIKIGDFGLARAVTANTASGQALLGTIAYLSPELVTRGVADTRSDIYAIGIMMYEMLTGEQPFKGEQPMQIAYQHANDRVPPPGSATNGSTPELDELVQWATSPDPADRPKDAQEMLDRLRVLRARASQETPTRATRVLPTATTVLPPVAGGGTAASGQTSTIASAAGRGEPVRPSSVSNVARLHRASSARRRRGRWIFAAVSLAAVVSAGAGWYLAGPGANATVPAVTGQPADAAEALLQQAGLSAARSECNSVDVPVGSVVQSDPPAGASVPQGRQVTLCLSIGPRSLAVPKLVGAQQADANALIQRTGFVVAPDPVGQFDAQQPSGVVLEAVTPDGQDLPAGASYPEGSTIRLIVSVGPQPDVSGTSVDEARTILTRAGLLVDDGSAQQSFDDKIPAGDVIGYSAADTSIPLRQGATVALNVSKGPELFPVPDVSGKTLADAKSQLEKAGFTVTVQSIIPEAAWGIVGVQSFSPSAGTMLPKGATVSVVGQF